MIFNDYVLDECVPASPWARLALWMPGVFHVQLSDDTAAAHGMVYVHTERWTPSLHHRRDVARLWQEHGDQILIALGCFENR